MAWETPDEERIYRDSIYSCLFERQFALRLEARPEVTTAAVLDAMNRTLNVNAALRPCRNTYYAYRVVYDRMESESALALGLADDCAWDTRAALFWGVFLLSGILWVGRAPFLPTLLLLLALAAAAFFVALCNAQSRSQVGCWARVVLHSTLALVLAPAVWFLSRRWARELISKGTRPVLTRVMEELLGEDHDSLLLPDSFDGLRTRGSPEHLVDNAAAQQLKRKIEQIDGGTIAVSGPRGSGKTTLLENCAAGGDFRVFAHAPATYAPHDFLTSLFVKVCEDYIDRQGYDAPQFVRLPHTRRILRRAVAPLRRTARWLGYALPAAGLIGLGLFASLHTLEVRHGDALREQAAHAAHRVQAHLTDISDGKATETALTLVGAGIALWLLRKSRAATYLVQKACRMLFGLLIVALQWGPVLSLALDRGIRHQAGLLFNQHPAGIWALLLALVWLPCLYQYGSSWKGPLQVAGRVFHRRRLFGPAVRLIPLIALALLLSVPPGRALVTDEQNPLRIAVWLCGILLGKLKARSWSFMRPEPRLVNDCRNQLYRLQTVQSTSAALNTGSAQVLNLGTSYTTSLATIPPNYPELVDDFRAYLTRIAHHLHLCGHRTVIAIDEVDRLGTDTQALAFLREIKAILGVPHVHYLISVAEDVGAVFVRRGLPHRDVTDSSLDDVVHVQPYVLAESGAILKRRAPGISRPYILLAHSLSGGLPRDLIRYGRRLMEIQRVTEHRELTDISRAVIIEELSETLAGFRTLLAKQQWSPQNSPILGSFRSLVGHLRTVCPCRGRQERLLHALEYFALSTAQASPAPDLPALSDEARTLIDEAAAYTYFSYTLLGIFGHEEFNRRRAQAANRGPDGDPELLAEARLELAISPYSARPLIDGIRLAWDLPTQLSAASAPLPPLRTTTCQLHSRL